MYKDKEKQKKYQNDVLRARRLKWIAENGPCKQCQSGDQLEVDHIDPTTKVSHKVWSWGKEKRQEELAKCQVLCYKCHKAKTKSSAIVRTHGLTMYENHGCRCEICRGAKSFKNSRRKR